MKLVRTQSYFLKFGDENDYVVMDDGQCIGRIMLHPQAPKDLQWFWTVTACETPPSHNKGYSATREDAMADFKARRTAQN